MSVATETFSLFIQENKANSEKMIILVEPGMSLNKLKKAVAKKLKLKTVKRLFLANSREVKFLDELKQDDEVFASTGNDFFKNQQEDKIEEFNVSVLGSGGVGKSALTIRYIRGVFVDHWDPTVEDAYSKITLLDNRPCKLKILDTAGQDNFDSMRPHWLKDKDAYVFVYSVDNEQSFKDLDRFVKLHTEINIDKPVPIVVAANKIDLVQNNSTARKISQTQGQDFASKLNAFYVETSALTGENVEELFNHLITCCRSGEQDIKPLANRCKVS